MGDLSRIEEYAERLPDAVGGATWTPSEEDAGTGRARVDVSLPAEYWFEVLREKTGLPISDEGELLSVVSDLAEAKKKWDRVEPAFRDVEAVEDAYRQSERSIPDEAVLCLMTDRMAFP